MSAKWYLYFLIRKIVKTKTSCNSIKLNWKYIIWNQDGVKVQRALKTFRYINGHEFEQALGVVDGQGSLVCCSPWGYKESDITEQLNWLRYIWNRNYKPDFFLKKHLAVKPVSSVICFQSLTFPKLLNYFHFHITAQIHHLCRAFSTRTNLIFFGYTEIQNDLSLTILPTSPGYSLCIFFLLTFDQYSPQTININTILSGTPSALFGAYYTMITFSNFWISLCLWRVYSSALALWTLNTTNLPILSW